MDTKTKWLGNFYAEHLDGNVWNVYFANPAEDDRDDDFIGPTADPNPYLEACYAGDWETVTRLRLAESGCDLPPNSAIDQRWERSASGELMLTDWLVERDPNVWGHDDEYDPEEFTRGMALMLAKLRNSRLFEEE